MRIKSLVVQGFRGFNERRDIDFHERLTLIYAPNSYGKTSISEALEWLLYGVTSKVDKADSKDEYKGCYRNRHFPETKKAFVSATFSDNSSVVEMRGELEGSDSIARFVDGESVQKWPVSTQLTEANRPFILQHALKYLLLVKPDDRFQKLAGLLGFEELDEIQRNFTKLCTKPDAHIPDEVIELRRRVAALEQRLSAQLSLRDIDKAFKRGMTNLNHAYTAVLSECRRRVPPETEEQFVLPQLLKIRDDAVGKVFKGQITLADYSPTEKQANLLDEEFFLNWVSDGFIAQYAHLMQLCAIQELLLQAQFFGLGVQLADRIPGICPLCGQSIDDALWQHIRQRHEALTREKAANDALEQQRDATISSLKELGTRINACQARHIGRIAALLQLEPKLAELRAILVPKHQVHFEAVVLALSQLSAAKELLDQVYFRTTLAVAAMEVSVRECIIDSQLAIALGTALVEYVADIRQFVTAVSTNTNAMSNADQVLRHELDFLAKTQDTTVLIDLLEQKRDVERKLEIDQILERLKELRHVVDQYAGKKVLQAVSQQLSSDVMGWYQRVKTSGDPDVHFSGFDMERTARGDLKARRVQVKAASYGKELASAVSCLSESKLNILGLCLSIANSLKQDSPFDFLLIDDPIQSMDVDHESQFVGIVRDLVDLGKQVILLSHNKGWLDQVRSGCRSLNGSYYEVVSYTQAGPNFTTRSWAKWRERLNEVDATIKDTGAGSVKLQQAEEEMRLAFVDLVCELYHKKTGTRKNPSSMNAADLRKTLVECGVDARLVDTVSQSFETIDDAHHGPKDYVPNRERIRRYYDYAHELGGLLK